MNIQNISVSWHAGRKHRTRPCDSTRVIDGSETRAGYRASADGM